MITPEDHAKRLELYNKGYTDPEIGKELYLAPNTVALWRKKYNLPSKYGERRQANTKKILECYNNGMTDREIFDCVGVSLEYIRTFRSKRGLPPNKKK